MSATSSIRITPQVTPNPNTLRYQVNRALLSYGSENYGSREEAEAHSPLATQLFDVPGVVGVMIGPDFVAVTTDGSRSVRQSSNDVIETLREQLEASDQLVTSRREPGADDASSGPDEADNEISSRIREILDSEIRPAVAMDGGDIQFDRYEDGRVYLRMMGACYGCPSSLFTLKMGVEQRLRQALPDTPLEVVAA